MKVSIKVSFTQLSGDRISRRSAEMSERDRQAATGQAMVQIDRQDVAPGSKQELEISDVVQGTASGYQILKGNCKIHVRGKRSISIYCGL